MVKAHSGRIYVQEKKKRSPGGRDEFQTSVSLQTGPSQGGGS